MNNFDELEVKKQQTIKEVDIKPADELVLDKFSIDPATIKSIKPRWKRTQYRAVINWLTKYNPQPDASNLDKVKGCLEAFYHLCEVEDWERANKILSLRLDTPTHEELHNQLDTWGYYRELFNLYNRILGKLNPNWDTIFFMVWARFPMFWETILRRLNIFSRV
jgi:hypothetical protein